MRMLHSGRHGRPYIGKTTSFDVLLTKNGGVLTNDHGVIGNDASSSNNTVIVTDDDSHWLVEEVLAVGNYGSGNRLVVSNGGVVASTSSALGNQLGSSSNFALVTGIGSIWSNQYAYIGGGGEGNTLVISNGGRVVHDFVQVGSSVAN